MPYLPVARDHGRQVVRDGCGLAEHDPHVVGVGRDPMWLGSGETLCGGVRRGEGQARPCAMWIGRDPVMGVWRDPMQ